MPHFSTLGARPLEREQLHARFVAVLAGTDDAGLNSSRFESAYDVTLEQFGAFLGFAQFKTRGGAEPLRGDVL